MYRFDGTVYRPHVQLLPCPGCGMIPTVVRETFRSMRPEYYVLHANGLCQYGDSEPGKWYHPSEAIRDWNQWTVLVRDCEGMDPWL